MTDAELSRAVALAIGYHPESVQTVGDIFMVWHSKEWKWADGKRACMWHEFSYTDPTVSMPLLKWLMAEHGYDAKQTRYWAKMFCVSKPGNDIPPWSETLEWAIARAVIEVSK